MKMKLKGNILGITEAAGAALLITGALTFFRACDASEGKYMACHWAQNAVVLSGAILLLLSLLRIFIPNRAVKSGVSLGVTVLSAATAFIPAAVINLCMMDTMRCHTVFRPAVIAVSAVIAVIALTDTVLGLRGVAKENGHQQTAAS